MNYKRRLHLKGDHAERLVSSGHAPALTEPSADCTDSKAGPQHVPVTVLVNHLSVTKNMRLA